MNPEKELNTMAQTWKARMEGYNLSEKKSVLKRMSCLHSCKEKEGN